MYVCVFNHLHFLILLFLFSLLVEGIKMTKITNLLTTKTTKNNKSTQQFVSHYGSFMSKVCSHTFYKLKIKKKRGCSFICHDQICMYVCCLESGEFWLFVLHEV